MVGPAHVTMSAILAFGLTKVSQELAAAAHLVVGCIVHHGIDALDILFLAFIVDRRREVDIVLTVAQPCDKRLLALRYEVDDVTGAERSEHLVHFLLFKAAVHGDLCLLNVLVIGKQSSVKPQDCRDDLFFGTIQALPVCRGSFLSNVISSLALESGAVS